MEHQETPSSQQRESIDRLAGEFEAAYRAGQRPEIERFVADNSGLRKYLLRELIALEIQLRRSSGAQPSTDEYRQRFPEDGSLIEAIFFPATDMVSTVDQSLHPDVVQQSLPKKLGRYVIQRQLGKGGFGVVYLAHDPQLDRFVALKIPRRERFTTLEQVTSFIQEARTAAKLKHPGLVAVHDVQEDAGLPYIVQEYIDGDNLAVWAAKHQPSFEQIAKILIGVTEALGYAHQQRLTHCDLKLANVLMDQQGRPYVADFGLAVHESVRASRKGSRFGTPSTMAPEQVRGEGHRLDGRTDLWALGVMLYELLVSQKPFAANSHDELFNEIETLDPRPPRQIDRHVPRELERICLKCLQKRRTERYNTADDLREDLQAWLAQGNSTGVPQSSTVDSRDSSSTIPVPDSSTKAPLKIIPKGLRSFDAEDADFFLDLLPGPRDRDGLPGSIRFWKHRIEEIDADKTFAVGLIYGPSGCGKSSLVKAGLIPQLSDTVLPIYVEATAADTEVRILKQLHKQMPRLAADLSLAEAYAELRQTGAGRHRKLLIVIDQFEQWLHAHPELKQTQLVDALRQCEGGRLQTLLLVRDDFFASVHRLFQELENPLLEGRNYALIDKFDVDHARKVLIAFGRAYGKLGESLSVDQTQFVEQAVQELTEDAKVICIRLSLFADMMKMRSWIPSSLKHVGGVGGVGETFLEETFSSKAAPPSHRVHEAAIRQVLKALLPDAGMNIKGGLRSEASLREAAGYQFEPNRFAEVVRILDQELRIITPTEPDGERLDVESKKFKDRTSPASHCYQLTHDYLVPSLRGWLTRKQKETLKGRAELKLAERSALWNAKPENRHLPGVIEWANIRLFVSSKSWTELQHTVMRKAARVHGMLWGRIIGVLLVAGVAIYQYVAYRDRQWQLAMRQQEIINVRTLVDSLQAGKGEAIPWILNMLELSPTSNVYPEIYRRLQDAKGQQKLSLAYALARRGMVDVATVVEGIVSEDTLGAEIANIVDALRAPNVGGFGLNFADPNGGFAFNNSLDVGWSEIDVRMRTALVLSEIQSKALSATARRDLKAKARLAIVAMYLGELSIAEEMLRAEPDNLHPLELQNPQERLRQEDLEFERLSWHLQSTHYEPLARAYYHLDRPQDALSLLYLLGDDKSMPEEVLLLQALCFARVGSAEKADEAVRKLVEKTKTPGFAELGSILTQAWLGNLDEANRQFEELVAKNSENPTALYNTARIAAQLMRVYGENNPKESNRLTERSVELLRKADGLGYRGGRGYSIDTDLDFAPLYGDANFRKLVWEVSWYPAQRTAFIAEFPEFSFKIGRLAEKIERTDSASLRSGISLAVGSVKRPDEEAKYAWSLVFERWYSNKPDAGTHSAASWALRQWGFKPPAIEPTRQPSSNKDWWQTPLNLTMVRIPPGAVRGSSSNAVPIAIKESFWLSDREISIELFKQFKAEVNDKPDDWKGAYKFENRIDDTHPVQQVSWEEAVMFCNWLSEKHGLDKCYEIEPLVDPRKSGSVILQKFEVKLLRNDGFRLPTADEWEYACRAKTTTDYSGGDDEEQLKMYAVFAASRTNACGSKMCNPWGLYDMHGNVWEWCWDSSGSDRINRGGSWFAYPRDCQSSSDSWESPPSYRNSSIGFRVAQGPSAQLLEAEQNKEKEGEQAEPSGVGTHRLK